MTDTQRTSPDIIECTYCFNGHEFTTCTQCSGVGCKCCKYTGEESIGKCQLCSGTLKTTRALVRIYEAHKRITSRDKNWTGKSLDYPGITDYGLAQWFLARNAVSNIYQAQGIIDDYGECQIWILARRCTLVKLSGLSWGYSGEGPSGLSYVLADIGFFSSIDKAKEFVAHQSGIWVIKR